MNLRSAGLAVVLAASALLRGFPLLATPAFATDLASTAAGAINALGIDLLQRTAQPSANALLSPYSIESALAMTYAGAEGDTRKQMAHVLHFPPDDARLHGAFAALRRALDDVARESVPSFEGPKEWRAAFFPATLTVANRLFGQTGYGFREPFLALLKDNYAAPLEQLDFVRDSTGATHHINSWVENQTRQRIRQLIPAGALDKRTRLVLVNAIYLKAQWAQPFRESATQPRPFHFTGGATGSVPTMSGKPHAGYARRETFSVVTIPYWGEDLQFLILMPDNADGLAKLEQEMTPKLLAEVAALPEQEVILYLPKFKLDPPVMSLVDAFEGLGMNSAFDVPPGSANFERMAPRWRDDYLSISKIFHKTFLHLDEKGTEAAAAGTVESVMTLGISRMKPVEVRVDRPFVFAIQHRASSACLFLGRVTDPR